MNLNPEPHDVEITHEEAPAEPINPGHGPCEGELIIADEHQQGLQPPVPTMHHHTAQQQMHNFQHNHFMHQQHYHSQMHAQNHSHMHTMMQGPMNLMNQQMNALMSNRQHINQNVHPPHYNQQGMVVGHHGQVVNRNVASQATCELPSTEEFPGTFDFHINVTKALEESKRPAWELSEMLHKLFVMEARSVPIQFKVNKVDPLMYIRAVAVYTDPDSSNKPVLRCPNHRRPDEPLNSDYNHIDHVVRCNNSSASYETDPVSQRRSVSVPLGVPQPGSDFVTILYSMMCRSSCINGISRRSVAIVFTLEIDGRVYGRRVLPIRVCASPHRDRRLEEARATKNVNGELSPTVTVKEEALAPVVGPSADGINDPLGPLDQMFFVPVNNCDDYIVLARMALEMVIRDYPEGPQKDAETQRYQSILNTMGEGNGGY